jgi:hypothetical protein
MCPRIAQSAVGSPGGFAFVPNPDLFIPVYVRREAVLSSQIEGTHHGKGSFGSILPFLGRESVHQRCRVRSRDLSAGYLCMYS